MFLQPFAVLALTGVAIAVHPLRRAAVVGVLIPDVEAERGGVVLVAIHQRPQELLGQRLHVFVVEAKAGKAAGCAGSGDAAVSPEIPSLALKRACGYLS